MKVKKVFEKSGILMVVTAMVLIGSSCKKNQEKHDTSGNPLKHEMSLLQNAYDTIISVLLLDGDMQAIVHAFHSVHEAKHHTESALEKKEITLPKNGDKIEEFMKLDGEFHGLIEKMVEAAQKNDRAAIQSLSATMLGGCIGCHEKYRN